ncbi:MAG: hypothetical protein L6R38_002551 [Xanthoria sp. 2 TBL-2021]|nr:MAG: hypothetical protein L6R38_002551 [Xanthoria sp. 2 TBL-2021]
MAGTNPISALLIIIITIFLPPVGVWMIAGCGADLYFPGHIHAFYLEYVYFDRRSQGRMGNMAVKRAPGVYSDNVNSGGRTTYGTIPT